MAPLVRWSVVLIKSKTKIEYFKKIDVSKTNDNKMFGENAKSRFSRTANTIISTEGNTITKNEKFIAGTFNNYFVDIRNILKLKKHLNFDGQSLPTITEYFKNNQSVIKIKEKYVTQENSFSFTLFLKVELLKR